MTKKASVLIVDDIVDNLKLLNEILSTSGFNVRPADNGQLAVSSAVAEKPDMILLDVRMPEMDGFEVCRMLKVNHSTADIPVIFISAYDELSDRLKGFELGAVDFITKPFEPREVIARINTQLELSHLRRESIRQATELLNSNQLLQEKNEEIAAQNEELQCQTEELRQHSEQYQKQNEELIIAKKTIEEKEAKLAEAQSIAHMGNWEFDLLTNKLFWSDEIFRIFEIDKNTNVASYDAFINSIHPDDRESANAEYLNSLRTRQSYKVEHRLMMPDGRIKYVLEECDTFYDFDNKPVRSVGIMTDISERKKAEEEKNKLQEQLNQSQKMESVGRLAGGVAHDFNNMLSVILGQAQLALMDIEDSNPLKHTLEQITVAAKRSADLTRQLLAFARKQIITPKIIDVNETVEGILKLLKRLIGEDISLLWIPSPQALNVKMDPVQVDQLLTNMLVNSRDAISGEGEITVSAAFTIIDQIFCELNPGAVAGDYVLLQVSDNGCGMTTGTIENIFEPFYTTKEIGKGTGLGMATVYGIIKQNQGFITVHSEVSIGSTFKIYLPCYTVTSSGAEVKGRSEKAVGGNETILVVEDENAVLEITKDMLESLGYQVMTYTEPQKAVEFIRSYSGKLDLLISDVIMPAMNGRDLANSFRAVRADLKTLFMSGYTAENIDRHGMLDEGVCFLQKPFSRKELADKVREAIKK